ncbi:MAG TPA: class I SAM-dependent methyltransferase [Vampirovibrionales bacterium]
MSKINQGVEYIKYLIRAFHLHGIHSPFVYQLNEEVFQERTPFYCFDEIESIRAKLVLTKKTIGVDDFGAGSKKSSKYNRRICDIAKTSIKRPKYSQLLYRLIYHFKPTTILELGTSLGISAAYMAKANPKAKVVSIEGASELSKVAEINCKKLSIDNLKLVSGNFDSTLEKELKSIGQLDFAFFDGNHKKEPTLNYFEHCLTYATEDSIFVFDDIYWSKEMTEAWKEIKKHPKVTITVDCFEMGVVFFKKEQAKEHFTVYH